MFRNGPLAYLKWSAILAGLCCWPACEFPSRVTQSQEKKTPEVYEVHKDTHGLVLNCVRAGVEPPAKVALLFSVQNAAGAPVKALVCENFVLYEDSARISAFESEYRVQNKPPIFRMHTILLLDMSGSVVNDKLDSLQAAAAAFVRTLLLGTAAANVDLGVYWFDGSEHIHELAGFTTDTSSILAALQGLNEDLVADRSTNLHGALIEGIARARVEVLRHDLEEVAHAALVVFTDGTDRADRFSFAQAKTAVDSSGPQLSVYMIALGEEINEDKLRPLAKDGFVRAADLAQLVPKFDETARHIQQSIESRYLLEYCSPKRKGRHTLKIEAMIREAGELSGSITISFPADGFMGGCRLEEPGTNCQGL